MVAPRTGGREPRWAILRDGGAPVRRRHDRVGTLEEHDRARQGGRVASLRELGFGFSDIRQGSKETTEFTGVRRQDRGTVRVPVEGRQKARRVLAKAGQGI